MCARERGRRASCQIAKRAVVKRSRLPAWESLEPVEVGTLKATRVSGHFDMPIERGINQVFCAAYHFWVQELLDTFPTLRVLEGENYIDAIVDPDAHYEGVLAERNLFARAGTVTKDELRRLDDDLLARFPRARPFGPEIGGGQLYFVVYFDKKMPWKTLFDGGLSVPFEGAPSWVESFGFVGFDPKRGRDRDLARQVAIHHADNEAIPEELILSLHPRSESDEILIGMVEPEETLKATYEGVLKRIGRSQGELEFGMDSVLEIPKINLNIVDGFPRSGEVIVTVADQGIKGPIVGQMRIAMSLDERGATAFARGRGVVSASSIMATVRKPFLVAYRERGADAPYIAAWIENAELLVSTGKKREDFPELYG